MTPQITRLSSSLRARSAEESLPLAASVAMSRGVSRVTDTTWLDRIGLPVYASIRPDGLDGSVCVHAGKGFTHAEAKIGAYMEAIEVSFCAPGRSKVVHSLATPGEILKSFAGGVRFPDFCPLVGAQVSASDQLAVVQADEICAGLGSVLVPAELVYLPFPANPGPRLYGTSTNGLASGNTRDEAIVHGLTEVMERHVQAIDSIKPSSVFVDPRTLSPKLRAMVEMIERAGLLCSLRYTRNEFGMAFFTGYVLEPLDSQASALSVTSGFGFHPVREIAAVRALAEAAQVRLTYIHGGRDDLIDRFSHDADQWRAEEARHVQVLRERALDRSTSTFFGEIPDLEVEIASLDDARTALFDALRSVGMNHVAVVDFTEPDYPFQVVKVIVPGAELRIHGINRVGPRLLEAFKRAKNA